MIEFVVRRASWETRKIVPGSTMWPPKPCKDAYRHKYTIPSCNLIPNPKPHYQWRIKVSSLQQLLDLIEETDSGLIISSDPNLSKREAPEIQIYDEYIEI